MSKDLDLSFSGLDDNEDEISENKEKENLIEKHKNFGINSKTIKILETLIEAKKDDEYIFPSVFFCNLLDKFENNIKEIQDNLFNFYDKLAKYRDNIEFEQLKNIINMENKTNLDTFTFWLKKINFNIFNNLLKLEKINLCNYLKNYAYELIEKGYEVKNIFDLMKELTKKLINEEKKDKNKAIIDSIMKILKIYKINGEFYGKIKKYITNLNINSSREIYTIAIKNQESVEDLNLNELIEEIQKRNPKYFTNDIKSNIMRQISIITETYKEYENYKEKSDINYWVKNIFPTLLDSYKNNENKIEVIAKILAVISIANEIFTKKKSKNNKGYKLRTIQLIDVLLFIGKEEGKGLIEQISTGEGKSTIICALATFLALIEKKVDIITSALNLAKRDVKELKDFYDLFNLTVDYVEHFNPRPYKANIIYGTFLEFEGDILEELSADTIIRGKKRGFEVLIVDEIDNLFIDNIDGSTRLCYSTMGYQFLAPIFMNIFFVMKTYENEISKVINNIISKMGVDEEEKIFLINKINDENFKKENIYPLIKLFVCNFIKRLYGMNKDEENEEDNIEVTSEFEKKFKEEIEGKYHLPLNLRPIFESQLESWLDNAYKALFVFQEKRDYVVSNGIIAPVDWENTGEIEQRKVYRNGLHRMLEIKHKLRLNDESLNHTFLSHISYFDKYKKTGQLLFYGMTGTLGDENTINIFNDKEKFNSDVVFIPTYKAKRFVEFPAILCKNEEEQIRTICEEIEFQMKNKRKILVINNSIKEAIKLRDSLKCLKNINSDQIGLYTRDDDQKEMSNIDSEKKLQIILSTNLAGRGTDIKTNPTIEENGGLHIILTSMPSNLRIEKQAYGRTSRQGNKGSGQMILLTQQFKTLEAYKAHRDELEKKRLDNMSKIIKQTLFKDKLFDKYILFLKRNYIPFNTNLSRDIDERWGIFLDEFLEKDEDLDEEKKEKINTNFDVFVRKLKNIINNNRPYNKYANSFICISEGWNNNRNNPYKQIKFNQYAKEKEKFAFAAYYYDALALIKIGEKGKYEVDNIKNNLIETQNILNRILDENVNICYNLLFLGNKGEYEGSPIMNQMLSRKQLLVNLISHVQKNLDIILKYEKSNIKDDIEIIYKSKDLDILFNIKDFKNQKLKEMDETLDFLKNSGLHEIYDYYLKRKYKWYEKLLYFLKIPFEFILGFVLFFTVPIVGLHLGGFLIYDACLSCINYFSMIHQGIEVNTSDYLLNKRIYYNIGRSLYKLFYFVKDKFSNNNLNVRIAEDDSKKNNPNFLMQSGNLNKIKNASKELLNNFINDQFAKIVGEEKEFIKYLLCFDDYLSNNFWKNEIKNNLIKSYKINFKEKIKPNEKNILDNLIKGYEANDLNVGNSVKSILEPIIIDCIKSFIDSLKVYKQKIEYNENEGFNSLEHLIRNLNPEKIDDSLAQEIVILLKKKNIINNEGQFLIQSNEKSSLKFIIETNIKNVDSQKEISNIEEFSLYGISKYPIINDEMNDRILEYKRNFANTPEQLKIIKLSFLNKIFIRTLDSIIQTFSPDKLIFDYLENLRNLMSNKIMHLLNKKIYAKLNSKILGDITSSSLKEAEMESIKKFKKIFLGKE